MKQLKVGDRVKMRGFDAVGTLVDQVKGVVDFIHESGDLYVLMDSTTAQVIVTRSQCVALIKKRLKRRWIVIYDSYASIYYTQSDAEVGCLNDLRKGCVCIEEDKSGHIRAKVIQGKKSVE